jgi:small GTP-binding protein
MAEWLRAAFCLRCKNSPENGVVLSKEDIYGKDDYLFKCVMLGKCLSGKSCLLRAACGETWQDECVLYVPTIGVDFRVMNGVGTGEDGKTAKVQLWDTSGDEKYESITTAYLSGYRPIIVFDLTSRSSYQNAIKRWVPKLPDTSLVLLVGTKNDSADKVEVLATEAQRLADERGWEFAMLSAKADPKGVQEAISSYIGTLRKAYDDDDARQG